MLHSLAFTIHNIPKRTEILQMTETCLKTLEQNTKEFSECEILLINNGSKDGGEMHRSLNAWAAMHPNVRAVSFAENIPLAAAWNFAITETHGDFISLLNNDVTFNNPTWLEELTSPLFSHGVGATSSRQLSWNGFDFLEGAFIAFRRDTALELASDGKVFDEQFLFTCEDVDFSQQLVRAGYQLVVTPIENLNHVTHLRHGTLCWTNEEGGVNGRSVLDIMHESRRKLCAKYNAAMREDD